MLKILREHWEDMKLELAEYLCLECSRCRNRSPQHFELQGIMDDGEAGLFLLYRCLVCNNQNDVGDIQFFQRDEW